jgi:hypothetical protein
MQAASRPDLALVCKQPNGRERLDQLLEIYTTALDELRAMRNPRTAGLIATLESLYTATVQERRYLDAAADARRRLGV